MIKHKRVSLKDVAQYAGVSTGTVSMVLNKNPSVAAKTRLLVQQAIEKLGYVYNRSGAQLRNRRTGVIGVSICNLANPFFAEVTAGIEEALEELGYALILGNSVESVAQQTKFLNTAREHNVEGLILMPAIGTTREMVEKVLDWQIPLIMVSRYIPGVKTDYAGTDNYAALVTATEHLLQLGHRKIAFVGANARTSTGRDRVRGYRAAMRAAGLDIPSGFVAECDTSREQGFQAVKKLFANARVPPTAIVCFNDLLAFGVMLGLRSLGMEPGRDCSVVGVDDVVEAALWKPGLTTVAMHSQVIGQNAGKLLRKRLGSDALPPEKILLKPELVVRDSSSLCVKTS